ncbi:c-type cytochrome [Sorangium sp. So ce233]|uniref:c-type cytochrome n=1 Tax=Sorangium sp. So ce233 TaxID=3133290 RepID=UPI003F5E082B
MRVRSILLLCMAPFFIGALQGCGGDDDGGDDGGGGDDSSGTTTGGADCSLTSNPQVQQGRATLDQQCLVCHTKEKTGDQRLGASEDVNVDDQESLLAEAGEIIEAVEAGEMPPGSQLPEADIEAIKAYLDCGAP